MHCFLGLPANVFFSFFFFLLVSVIASSFAAAGNAEKRGLFQLAFGDVSEFRGAAAFRSTCRYCDFGRQGESV